MLGGCWAHWWLKTPLPGVVWCNCPHMAGLDGLKVEDLTARRGAAAAATSTRWSISCARSCRASSAAIVIDVAPQTGVRQTRLLEGEYVMTKEDLAQRTRFADSVARGRDYYTPYRALLPKQIDNLLVAGRHYSATSPAQKMSREIPPCMAMGEAAGVAAALALDAGVRVRDVDVKRAADDAARAGRRPGRPDRAATPTCRRSRAGSQRGGRMSSTTPTPTATCRSPASASSTSRRS